MPKTGVSVEILASRLGAMNIEKPQLTDTEIEKAFESMILKAALSDETSDTWSKTGDAMWGRSGCVAAAAGPNCAQEWAPVGLSIHQLDQRAAKSTRTKYDDLSEQDYELQRLIDVVAESLDGLHFKEGNSEKTALDALGNGIKVLTENLGRIRSVVCETDEEDVLQDAMIERYEEVLLGMEQAEFTIRERETLQPSPHVFHNGGFFESQLDNKDPVSLFAAFVVIALNVFGSLVREWANTALKLQIELLRMTYKQIRRGGLTEHDEDILDGFPRDIRSARKLFDIEPQTMTYAACPKCSATYRVDNVKKPLIKCDWKRFKTGKPCDTKLTKVVIKVDENGERINTRAPIRPFLIQDFDAFKGSLLSRPGMEAILDRGTLFNDREDMWDIKDGTTIKEMKGPDGKPFLDGLKRSELRLLWSLSVDWYNPFLNKAAGKAASTGSMVMGCLNLPPSLRYKAENLYLVGVIPGPREPSVEEVGHFMNPVVEMLERSWRDGTTFERTESSLSGRTERSMLALIVTDMVASRKITGVASHSFKALFCSLCSLAKNDINNLQRETWPARTREAQKEAAERWRDASTKSERKQIFKKTGVRWSPFWNLGYYDPSKMVVVDSMHNLFLGLAQFHIREVLGIEETQAKKTNGDRKVTEKEMVDARNALQIFNRKGLSRARVSTLQKLCFEREISVNYDNRPKKNDLIHELLQHSRVDRPSEASSATQTRPETNGEPTLIGDGYFEDFSPAHKSSSSSGKGNSDVFVDKVTKEELKKLQSDIASVTRPQYRQGPPLTLGNAGHGKLKADQWKTCMEFDIPVSVAQLWSKETCQPGRDSEEIERRDKIFQSIMLLAVALRWGTSYRTSEHHAAKYEEHMKAYLQSLLSLYPDIKFRPNHHAALHIGELLLQFGPVHGWWMFPFERIIGILQKINTNSKMGELESTMLTTFCAGANLKALLQGERCPRAIRMAAPLLENKWNQDRRTGTIGEVNNLRNASTSGAARKGSPGRRVTLVANDSEAAFRAGFSAMSKVFGEWAKFQEAEVHKRVAIGGVEFAKREEARRDAEVFFQPLGSERLVPGVIENILSVEDDGEDIFVLCVRPRQSLPSWSNVGNPFCRYPDFGAELWSSEFSDDLVYVPATQPLYHSQSRPWGEGVIVLKPVQPLF